MPGRGYREIHTGRAGYQVATGNGVLRFRSTTTHTQQNNDYRVSFTRLP